LPPTSGHLPAKSFGLVIDVPGVTARSLAFDVLSPLEHLTGREAVNGCLRPDYVESVVGKVDPASADDCVSPMGLSGDC